MRGIVLYLKRLDWVLIGVALLLVGMGLLSIYSSSLGRGDFSNLKKQMIFSAIGFFLMIGLSFFDWRALRDNRYLIFILYLLSLLALAGLFFLAPEIREVKRWYRLGPLSIDPIEFSKIILIILLAKYFSLRHIEIYQIKHILLSGFYVLLPALLLFLQPDLGSVLGLIILWIGVLVVSGIRIRHFLILCLIFLLTFIFSWFFLLKDYQKERILTFLALKVEPLGASWSQDQAKIAIGSGGLLGQGFGQGSQTQYGFLPEPQTDFIFAAIAEEFGFIGISILFILFLILFWRMIKIAILAQSNFPRLFALGSAIFLVSQVFINIGMNLSLLPVIGIPLPLVSYGGSSLISTFLILGILESIELNP